VPVRKRHERWEVRVSVGDGRRVERTLPAGATKADALALEATLRRRQIAIASGQQPDRLIDEALTQWVESSAQHLKSWDKDLRYRVQVLREYTAGKALDAIPEVAEAVKAAGTREGLTPAAINRYLAILRRLGNLAVRWGWTDRPLGQRVVLLPGERRRDVYLTPAQVRQLAKAAGGEAGDAVMFAAYTGLRRGELLRLTPDMIRDGLILLDSATKSGKPRAVPLHPVAAKIAARRLPWTLTPKTLRERFEAARAACEMPHVRYHDLRHAFGSWLAGAGVPLTSVRDLMGHSSLAVTSRYAHVAAPHLREAVAALPGGARTKAVKR
jgi:integrase